MNNYFIFFNYLKISKFKHSFVTRMESVTDKRHSMILALLSFNNTVNNTIQLISTKYFNTWKKYFSQQKMFDGK